MGDCQHCTVLAAWPACGRRSVVISWALAQGSTRQCRGLRRERRSVVISWALAQGSTRHRCGAYELRATADDLTPPESLMEAVPEPSADRRCRSVQRRQNRSDTTAPGCGSGLARCADTAMQRSVRPCRGPLADASMDSGRLKELRRSLRSRGSRRSRHSRRPRRSRRPPAVPALTTPPGITTTPGRPGDHRGRASWRGSKPWAGHIPISRPPAPRAVWR